MTETNEIPWGALGQQWWIEQARECGARDARHAPFAACLHAELSMTESARRAGYPEHRANKAGSEAAKTVAVKTLLTLAAAQEKIDGVGEPKNQLITREDMRRKLSDIMNGPGDAGTKMKAMDLYERLFGKDDSVTIIKRVGDGTDGLAYWRLARMFLGYPNGATAFVLLYLGQTGAGLGSLPMYHDVASAAKRQDPELWGRLLRQHSLESRLEVERIEADRDWQRDARRTLWSEIGVSIDDADRKAFQTEGAARPALEANQHRQTVAA